VIRQPVSSSAASSLVQAKQNFTGIYRSRSCSGAKIIKSTAVGEALHPQIEALIPRLRRYARALVRDPVAADDLVQDCLARALGKIHQWHEGTDLRAWLFTILHNQHISLARRIARERDNIELQKSDPNSALSPNQTARLELRDLERAIAKLSEEQRAVILLTGLEGMGYDEIASVLNLPVGTVRSRLSRGRETLRVLTGLFSNRHRLAIKRRPVRRRPPIEDFVRFMS
jgi:RNA polymerase sigma factor (sigma-70 family)